MCLYTASATPVLPTGYTTRQGLASSSSRMHDSCPCHIYTRLQEASSSCPLKAMQLNTQFSWSNTYDRLQDKSSTHPCPSSHSTSWVLSDGQEIWSFHGYGRSHTILPHIHQPTTQLGSRTKSQHPQLGQTPPDIRQVCKWPPSPKKGRFEISLCQKEPMTDIPEQFCTFTALLYIISGIKWWKISVEQSQLCPP